MLCLGFASVVLLETKKNVILEENYHPLEMPVIRVNGTLSTTERMGSPSACM